MFVTAYKQPILNLRILLFFQGNKFGYLSLKKYKKSVFEDSELVLGYVSRTKYYYLNWSLQTLFKQNNSNFWNEFDVKLDLATMCLYILLPHGFEEKNAKNPATQ